MENIKTAINLLNAVRATMETISVAGIENQDKFVGCANAIQTAAQAMEKYLLKEDQADENDQEEVNGR